MRRTLALVAAAGAAAGAVAGCGGGTTGGPREPGPAAGAALPAFASCDDLLRVARARTAAELSRYGVPATDVVAPPVAARESAPADAAAPAGAAGGGASATNVQEAGVDEPDMVKTADGRMFVATDGTIRALDVGDGPARLRGRLDLDGAFGAQLLLSGDRLLVLARTWAQAPAPVPDTSESATAIAEMPVAQETEAVLVDVADPANMRVLGRLRLGARVIDARLTGHTARVVVAARAGGIPGVQEPVGVARALDSPEAALERNRTALEAAPLGTWLPTMRVEAAGRVRETPVAECSAVRHTRISTGTGLLGVLTIDLDKGVEPVDRDAVMTDATTVYASADHLYVGTPRPLATGADGVGPPVGEATQIHRFDVSRPGATAYEGSGAVPGTLLSQWAMSEHEGVLRVASTASTAGPDGSEGLVTTMRWRDGRLARAGQVRGLGPGERVRAVRFMGDTGYVVTFRQTDPLYVVDLSDPAAPAVRGELHMPGYSAYLHPVGDGLLLGVGQDATETGALLGSKASLFDVSDPARPRLVDQVRLGGWSTVDQDHHAFLWWGPSGLALVPAEESSRARLLGLRVQAGRLRVAGTVTHGRDGDRIHRAVVAGGHLYSVGDGGVAVSTLDTLRTTGWTAFG